MDSFKSPLRYPGGKRNLYSFISSVLKKNNLVDGTYIEPYAGGAGAALELLFREYVQQVHLNDFDYHIYSFWKSILNDPDEFIYRIKHVDVNIDEWHRQRLIYLKPRKFKMIDVGFSTYFLNRCNRSGILGGRPIGGLEQTGPWKIDARFNKENQINRIRTISYYRERIHIHGEDAKAFLEKIKALFTPDDKVFIYLDPPYYIMGQELYLNNYNHDDHLDIANCIKSIPYSWMLSYDDVPQIRKIYKEKRRQILHVNYKAHLRKQAKELLYFSDNIDIPH